VTDTWGPPINTTHVSVIVDEGKGYLILNDTSGVGGGQAKKQFVDGKCSNATLNGSFGLLATGTVIGEGGFAAAGRLRRLLEHSLRRPLRTMWLLVLRAFRHTERFQTTRTKPPSPD
jgi:hypothetical protein